MVLAELASARCRGERDRPDMASRESTLRDHQPAIYLEVVADEVIRVGEQDRPVITQPGAQ
jgi:hypothetical protein